MCALLQMFLQNEKSAFLKSLQKDGTAITFEELLSNIRKVKGCESLITSKRIQELLLENDILKKTQNGNFYVNESYHFESKPDLKGWNVAYYECCNGSEIKYWKSVDKPKVATDEILEKINKGIELNSCEKEYITKILTSINQNNDVFAIKDKSKLKYDTNEAIKICNQKSETDSNIEKTEERSIETSYATINICGKTWMAENLDLIDEGLGKDHWKNSKSGEVYYTWEAAKRLAKKVPGYHLPTAKEWNELAEACGGVCFNPSKKTVDNDYDGCQELKRLLNIKLVGYYNDFNGSFYYVGSSSYFWTATEYSSSYAYFRYLHTGASLSSDYYNKYYGYSVRLVADS